MTDDLYITTSIPYVNGAPHLGHALEFVHVDVLARHRRLRGGSVRVQSGTDDHAIKNVGRRAAAGVGIADLVAPTATGSWTLPESWRRHRRLRPHQQRPRHRAAVVRLWRHARRPATSTRGLHRPVLRRVRAVLRTRRTGCRPCREHGTPVQEVTESNWFFRLSRYREAIAAHPRRPPGHRTGSSGATRSSASWPATSTTCPCPGPPPGRRLGHPCSGRPGPSHLRLVRRVDQLHHRTGLGTAIPTSTPGGPAPRANPVIGKGIVRFHAVYWTAFLLSAGLPVPDRSSSTTT